MLSLTNRIARTRSPMKVQATFPSQYLPLDKPQEYFKLEKIDSSLYENDEEEREIEFLDLEREIRTDFDDELDEKIECPALKLEENEDAESNTVNSYDGDVKYNPILPVCSICNQALMDTSTGSGVERDTIVLKNIEYVSCLRCSQVLKSAISQSSATKSRPFSCNICKTRFTLKGNYARHMKEHKNTHKKKRLECSMCDNAYSRASDLKRHMMSHTNSYAFSCSICNRKFMKKLYWTNHMSTHCKENSLNVEKFQFKCPLCRKSFQHVDHFQVHFTSCWRTRGFHNSEKSFSCADCSKLFFDKDLLRKRVQNHLKVKPFPCPVCPRAFTCRQDLTRHMMIHTNEKPFRCPVCSRLFRRNTHLKGHLKIHVKEKQHSCSTCRETFTKKTYLKVHINENHKSTKCADNPLTSKNTYSCAQCYESFLNKTRLKMHITYQCPFNGKKVVY